MKPLRLCAAIPLVLLPLSALGGGAGDPQGAPLRVLLVGDAGLPNPAGEPVLRALDAELRRDPARTLLVFLGDNIYPNGMPAAEAPDRAEAERRLNAQVDVGVKAGVRTIFIPGNHDWDSERPDGWEAVRRQAAHVAQRGGALAEFLPRDGCPGPAVVDLPALRLVALDTQWWLHDGPRPEHPTSSCPTDSPDEVVGELKNALAAGRPSLVVGHHPLASGGPHGGKFSWRQHFFPLTDVKKGLWLPLPGIGSIYPLARKTGASDQDLSGRRNKAMRLALEAAFAAHPPLAYAAGHEHTLQVLRKPGLPPLLVSGTGFFDHGSPVYNVSGTVYKSSDAGFMRLDVDARGGARLAVMEVDREGRAQPAHAETLR